jgi:hypothetical protein
VFASAFGCVEFSSAAISEQGFWPITSPTDHLRQCLDFLLARIISPVLGVCEKSTVSKTGKNLNVFYELGLAHAIGKPIVLISESMDEVPFDLQSLRVVTYNKDHPEASSRVRASGHRLRFSPLYSLRHTHATLLLANGENARVASERLGHSTVVLTLDTYSHVLPDMQQQAAERIEKLLFKTGFNFPQDLGDATNYESD